MIVIIYASLFNVTSQIESREVVNTYRCVLRIDSYQVDEMTNYLS